MSATYGTGAAGLPDADLEQLSAWLDGELEPEQERVMLDRLKTDPNLRAQFEWFNLAGDALRSHEVAACHHPALVVQVCEALKLEPIRIGRGVLSGSKVRRHIATAVTIAAAAAMLVVVALPQLRGTDVAPAGSQVVVQRTVADPVLTRGAPALTTGAGKVAPSEDKTLDAYFRAHRELAATGVMPSAVAYIRMSGEPDR